MGLKTNCVPVFGAMLAAGLAGSTARAAVVVQDTWQDSSHTDPAAPVYSENGLDADTDTDIESAWYVGGTGATLSSAPDHFVATPAVGGGSMSVTTYFTPEAAPVTLGAAGDQMRVTWRFTTADVATASTGQDFRFVVVDSPSATRVTANGTPGAGAYTGYGIFGNMAETLGNNNPFQLRKRTGTGALLSASAEYTSFSPNENDGANGNTGYVDNTQYEMVFTMTRNASDGLDVATTMTQLTGTNVLDNATGLSVAVTDPTPSAFTFDTFHFRPSFGATTSSAFDTQLFQVEFLPVPEPTSVALLAGGALLLAGRRGRRLS